MQHKTTLKVMVIIMLMIILPLAIAFGRTTNPALRGNATTPDSATVADTSAAAAEEQAEMKEGLAAALKDANSREYGDSVTVNWAGAQTYKVTVKSRAGGTQEQTLVHQADGTWLLVQTPEGGPPDNGETSALTGDGEKGGESPPSGDWEE